MKRFLSGANRAKNIRNSILYANAQKKNMISEEHAITVDNLSKKLIYSQIFSFSFSIAFVYYLSIPVEPLLKYTIKLFLFSFLHKSITHNPRLKLQQKLDEYNILYDLESKLDQLDLNEKDRKRIINSSEKISKK